MNTLNNQEGFTIIELIITIVFISFALLGIYAFFHPAQILSANFSNHSTALRLGQEGMEVVKNIRDNNIRAGHQWLQGLIGCQNGCQLDYKTGTPAQTPNDRLQPYNESKFLKINDDGFYDYTGASVPSHNSTLMFKRKITITIAPASSGGPISQGTPDSLRVEVLVTWKYNNQTLSFTTVGYMYNYN